MPTPEKDRWHQLADAILASNLPASDKAILRFLLDKADWKTADLPERFTPTQRAMGKKTSHSLRQVKYSLAHCARHGWLIIREAENDSRRRTYVLELGKDCDCTERRHVAHLSATNSLSATPSATEEKVQRRRPAPVEADRKTNVAPVADSSAATYTERRHVADPSATDTLSATPSATEEKVQRRRPATTGTDSEANVAPVADSSGTTQVGPKSTGGRKGSDDTTDRQRKVQPESQKGATAAPIIAEIGATGRCNAAGQPPSHTERQREEDLSGGATIAETWDLTRQLRRCARCQERAAGRGGILCAQCQADIAAATWGAPANATSTAPTYRRCTRCKIRGYYHGPLCPTCQHTEEPSEQWPPHFGPELGATGTWG